MSLESLPTELKLWILREAIPDIATLAALVHASPSYHAVYLSTREKCLTDVTLRELSGRNIDILTPYSFVEVCTKGNRVTTKFLKSTIEHCYIQSQRKQKIKLSVGKCRALRVLTDLVGWTIDWAQKEPIRLDLPRVLNPCASPLLALPWQLMALTARFARDERKDDYKFDLDNYQLISFNIGKFPHLKPRNLPSVRLKRLRYVEKHKSVSCRFRAERRQPQ